MADPSGLPVEELAAVKAKICREELNEKETERDSQVEYMRNWIKDHPWLTCRTDDQFILRFLRTSKYVLPTAQKRIENFCMVRSSEVDGEPQWFCFDTTTKKVIENLEKGWIYKLPGLDDQGRVVIMTKFGNVKPKKLDLNSLMQASSMFFDWLLSHEECQIGGILLIEDCAGITLDHMTVFSHDVIKRSMKIWQDVSPMRLKEMHYINLPTFMNAMMELFMKFMSKKHQERVKIHWKPEHVFKKIPRRMLPKEYGGEGGTVKELVNATIEQIKSNSHEIQSLEICRVNDDKRPREVPEGDSWGMMGSYRKVDAF